MSAILYYSNYCKYCQELLKNISKSSIKDDVHFLCIDRRTKRNGATYIQLENGQEILLPPNISKVPSMLLLNRGNVVIDGNDVQNYFFQKTNNINNIATEGNGEPLAFSLNEFGTIVSDSFSFLDQGSDEMSAEGTGGLRQMHNYVAISQNDVIETPPDNYAPDKLDTSMTLDQIRAQRDKDIPPQRMRI